MEILLNIGDLGFCRFFTIRQRNIQYVLLHCKINIRDENMDEPILESRMMELIGKIMILSKCMIFRAPGP